MDEINVILISSVRPAGRLALSKGEGEGEG